MVRPFCWFERLNMPYAMRGNSVYKKDTGKLVGTSNKPKAYLRTLQAIEHGWKPSQKKSKNKRNF